jgi:hypothetical protein
LVEVVKNGIFIGMNLTLGEYYIQFLSGSSGVAPYSYQLASGTLPYGLALDSNGRFAGTPSSPGTFNFTIQTVDTNECVGTDNFTFVVA